MKKREKADQSDLGQSQDEILLSALMRQSLNGDAESYRLLLKKVKELMTPFIASTLSKFGLSASCGHEDVLQEVLLGVHLKRATYDHNQFFLPWMYAIARYKAVDFLRRNKASFKVVSFDEEFENLEIGTAPDLSVNFDLQALCECLPTKQRDLLLLVKVEGLSIREVSKRTGFSHSDIKVTVHRALQSLKKTIKDAGHEN